MVQTIDLLKLQLRVQTRCQTDTVYCTDTLLFCVLEGSLTITVSGQKTVLQETDLLLLNAGTAYSALASANVLFVQMPIPRDLLRLCGQPRFHCSPDCKDTERYRRLYRILQHMILRQAQNHCSPAADTGIDFSYTSEYFAMLDLLLSHFILPSGASGLPAASDEQAQRRDTVDACLSEHYAEDLSLAELAEHLGLSEAYLSRWIKRTYAVSFSSLLRKIRLSAAAEELLYTGHSVTRIAVDCGFSTTAYFTRVFKEAYGKSPGEYRRDARAAEDDMPADSKPADRLKAYAQKLAPELSGTEEPVRQLHTIDTSGGIALTPVWDRILNAGPAAALLQSTMQERILQLQESLRFSYIRIWSILSKELLINPEDNAQDLNFTRLDQVTDFIHRAGAVPFIDFEQKPKRINDSAFSMRFYEAQPVRLSSPAQLQELVSALLRHWIDRYGRADVARWKIEVWYDGIRLCDLQDHENFFAVFAAVHAAVRKHVTEMAVGGSGQFFEYALEESRRTRGFWQEWKQTAPAPDFISQINYAYETEALRKKYTRRSADEHYLPHAVRRLKAELAPVGWGSLPLYITEWNLTVSDRNYLNDSCFQAAYIVKNLLDLSAGAAAADMVGYYNSCDLLAEYYDSSRLLFGGSGLLTREGICKPAAYALEFLHALGSICCGRGEHYIVTKGIDDEYVILCHNAGHLNRFYYTREENEIEPDQIGQCFDDCALLPLSLRLTGIADGTYRMRIRRVNEQHGSILDAWKRTSYADDLSAEEIGQLRSSCIPYTEASKAGAAGGLLQIDLTLQPNEIVLIRLERITE